MALTPIKDIDNLTIAEILRYSLEERKGSRFNAVGIDKVIIDGNEFTDYKAFSFVWEDSYVKSPERSGSGVIENLNSYSWFLTPHLKIDFSMLSIDSYRRLIELKHNKREFVVTCYDPSYNRITTNKMYFPPEEMPKLLAIARALNGEEWVELLGVQDYTVEMIGTNASLDTVDILYYDNNGNLLNSQQAYSGEEAIINFTFTPSAGKKFEGEWITVNGTSYRNGDAIFVKSDNLDKSEIRLTANVVDSNEYTLSFDYGVGDTLVTQTNGDLVNIPIRNGETISTAISKANIKLASGAVFTFPANGTGAKSVVYDGKTYNGSDVYTFQGWRWSQNVSATRVYGTTKYNYSINRTIHQVYTPKEFVVNYMTNTGGLISISSSYYSFGSNVYLPRLARTGYTHNGWYTTSNFQEGTEFDGTMPPYGINIYAKWVKNQ